MFQRNKKFESPKGGANSSTFQRAQTLKETNRKISLWRIGESSKNIHKSGEARKSVLDGNFRRISVEAPLHSNSADLGKRASTPELPKKGQMNDFFKRKKEPKIIITPAKEELAKGKPNENAPSVQEPNKSMTEIPSPLMKPKSRVSGIFRKRTTLKNNLMITVAQIRHRQSLTREVSMKILKSQNGRLLTIIANQALFGKHQEISKTFLEALQKVNPKVLERARKEYLKKKKRRLRWYIRKLQTIFKKFMETWNPESPFIICWKSIILFLILVQSIFSTYILAFLPESDLDSTDQIFFIDLIIDIVYIFEIIANFRTAFYYRGELQTDSSQIAKNYLSSSFALDIISEISLIGRLASQSPFKPLILFDLLRIFHVPQLISRIEDYFQFSRKISSIFQLVKLVLAIIIFAHWWACCLYAITRSETNEVSWMITAELGDAKIIEIYVASLYWSITTMATIGYGDIHPVTLKERVLSIIIMIASSIIFGYILSSIGSLLTEINAYSNESRFLDNLTRDKMRLLTKYMSDKGLTKDIQSKIRKYLEFYLEKENTMKMEGDNILQLLSINLKEEIIKEINAKILGDTYMFSSNFRRKFLYIISKDLVEKPLAPDDIIFSHNDNNDASMYFVTSGKVEIFYEKCGVSVQKLEKGESFGFLSFFAGRPRSASVKSVEFTTVFQLKREKFLERLEEYPSEKVLTETYCMIKDSINLYENYQYINLRCYSCFSKTHITLNCPKFHVVFNKPQIIAKYLLEQQKYSRTFNRKPRRLFKAFKNLEELQESALRFQVVQNNELYYQSLVDEEVKYYSAVEEVLDRNIYEPLPIFFTAEPEQTKLLNVPAPYQDRIPHSLQSLVLAKEPSRRRGFTDATNVESFVIANYDAYYHNVNLDKVKSFEVYYPNNNITKLLVELERVRLEKIVQMRLGPRTKHISPLLVKSFKMNERRKSREMNSPSSVGSGDSSAGRKQQINRNISNVNPADITFYSSLKKNSVDFGIQSASLDSKRPDTMSQFSKDAKKGLFPVSDQSFNDQYSISLHSNKYRSLGKTSEEESKKQTSSPKRLQPQKLQPNFKLGLKVHIHRTPQSSIERLSRSDLDDIDIDMPPDASPSKKYYNDLMMSSNIGNKRPQHNLEVDNAVQSSMYLSCNYDTTPKSRVEDTDTEMRIPQFKVTSVNTINPSESDDVPSLSPFDFSKQMRKLSQKLEENNKSFHRKKKPSFPQEEEPMTESLVSMMVKAKNDKMKTKSKVRAPSEEQGKAVRKVIDEYDIQDIIQRFKQR